MDTREPDKGVVVQQPEEGGQHQHGKTGQPGLSINPNPRANENLDASPGVENADTVGVGSEVTDGEDG